MTLTAKKPLKIPQNPKTLGDHIKKRRLELDLTQKEVAHIIEVDESTIHNWERGHRSSTLRFLPKIIKFLGYTPEISTVVALGEKLKQYRKLLGINQEDFAKQLGIDPTTLSKLERGKKEPKGKIKRKIENFLHEVG